MMRQAPTPHSVSGGAPGRSRPLWRLRTGAAVAAARPGRAGLRAVSGCIGPGRQPPPAAHVPSSKSAFPKKKGEGILGPIDQDRPRPADLSADRPADLRREEQSVIAQGNVEIYYNNYILTADKIIYDQALNKLTAEGNAQLKDPNGSITRADRFEATDDFRDAFIQSLSVVTHDDTRIAAEKAVRKEGNVTEFERGQVHALPQRPGHAAAVVHRRGAHHSRPAGGDHHLPGCPVPAVRRADLLPAVLPAPRPVGEAAVRLPDAELQPARRRSGFSVEMPYYFALAPELRLHVPPALLLRSRRAVAGRLAPSPGHRPVQRQLRGHRRRDQRHRSTPISATGAGRSRPRASSRWRRGGSTAGT